MSPLPRSAAPISFLIGSLVGCATWSDSTQPLALPAPRLSPDSVVLEIAFVRLPDDEQVEDTLWRDVDEQHLPVDVRRRLAANGIRSGIAGAQIPEPLRRMLDNNDDPLAALRDGGSITSNQLFSRQQRITSRAGRPAKIEVTPDTLDHLVVLIHDNGRARGEKLAQAKGLFVTRTFPLGDGRVRLELTPQIQHGEARQRWVPGQGMFVMDAKPDSRTYDQLGMQTLVSPGQTLLVTCTPDRKGLGGHLFSGGTGDRVERWLMLVRLAQTQYDDLFAPQMTRAPLVTGSE